MPPCFPNTILGAARDAQPTRRRIATFLAVGCLFAIVATSVLADDTDHARRILLLRVQYVGSDYRSAVPEAGHVAKPAELAENLTFLREAATAYQRMYPAGPRTAELDRLTQLVQEKAAPSSVEALTDRIIPSLRRELDLAPAPVFFPDLGAGSAAFARRCANCHGIAGRGDGPDGATLKPAPRDLTDPAWADSQSPLQIFNSITEGIPGTSMTGFSREELASTRWAIAFYVATLRPKVAAAQEAAPRPWIGVTELASSSNRALAAELVRGGQSPSAALALADAARRSEPPSLTIAQAMSRLRSAALSAAERVHANRRSEAGEILAAIYFDAVEPVEPALAAVAPAHLGALEGRASELREAIAKGIEIGPSLSALTSEIAAIEVAMGQAPTAIPSPPSR